MTGTGADRRQFLKTAAVALAALAATGVAAFRIWKTLRERRIPDPRSGLAAEIRGQMGELRFDDRVLGRFLDDLEANLQSLKRHASSNRVDVAGRFLLSTDFFQNGADPSRPLQYVAFWDPYVTPCYNPMRRVY